MASLHDTHVIFITLINKTAAALFVYLTQLRSHMYSQICRSAALYRPYFGTLRILCSASTLLFPRKAPHRTERTAHLPNLNPVARHAFPPRSEFAACPSPGGLASHVAARLGLSHSPRAIMPPAAGRKFSASAYAQKSAAGNKFQLRQYAYHASADAARIPCRN